MSKGHTTSKAVVNGGSRQTQMHMHHLSQESKREMWAEMIKRKEEAKKPKQSKLVPLDSFYKGQSHQTAKAITALYLAVSGKKVSGNTIMSNYGLGLSTYQRYLYWYNHGSFNGTDDRINKYVFDNKDKLAEAMLKAPSPTIKETSRLYEVAHPEYFNCITGKVEPARANYSKSKTLKNMIAAEQAKATGEIPVINFDFDQKSLTKSDVVTGVITGALIGAAMTAYLFMSNGAI